MCKTPWSTPESKDPVNSLVQGGHTYGVASSSWTIRAAHWRSPWLSFLAECGTSRTFLCLPFPTSWKCGKDTESDTAERILRKNATILGRIYFSVHFTEPFNMFAFLLNLRTSKVKQSNFPLPILASLPRSPLGLSFSKILRNLLKLAFWFMFCLHLALKVAVLNQTLCSVIGSKLKER